jgi:aryl-alcohol dehydrogenase-like predicted oxidoreductase
MHKAFDLGITLFDAADTYGNGLSEELIAKAFSEQRDEIVVKAALRVRMSRPIRSRES